jgi:hypothetical protein
MEESAGLWLNARCFDDRDPASIDAKGESVRGLSDRMPLVRGRAPRSLGAAVAFAIAALPAAGASAQALGGIHEVTVVEIRDATMAECRIGTGKMQQALEALFGSVGLTVRFALEGPALAEDGSVRQPIRVRMGNVASYDRKRDLCYGYLEFQMLEHTGVTSARLAALDNSGDGRAFGDVEIATARITGAFAPGEYQRMVWTDVFASIKRFAALIGREAKS